MAIVGHRPGAALYPHGMLPARPSSWRCRVLLRQPAGQRSLDVQVEPHGAVGLRSALLDNGELGITPLHHEVGGERRRVQRAWLVRRPMTPGNPRTAAGQRRRAPDAYTP